MAVFLLGALAFSSFFYSPPTGVTTEQGILGGPADRASAAQNVIFATASAASDGISLADQSFPEAVLESGPLPAALSPSDVSAPDGSSSNNLMAYRVQKGDTLSGIASYFGVSIDTIVNANPSIRGRVLAIGDELNILPTSGSVYITKDGDTLESVSGYFNVPQDSIVQFNKSVDFNTLGAGVSLVIPGVRAVAQSGSVLPNLNTSFVKPAEGFNWGKLHHYNAVDISNSCGTPVVASAEGLVVPDDSFGDGRGTWNGGYGNFVLIEHPFGDAVRTRYAHLSKILVDIGDYVKQGQEIGLMGESGEATGCHVHFEVYGAQNPFAK